MVLSTLNTMDGRPDYIRMEPKGREELLSQLGSFSPQERALFQRLCDSWAPIIDLKRFVASNDLQLDRQQAPFDRLMSKLKKCHLGLYLSSVEGQERRPVAVVLTNPEEQRFFFHLLSEALDELGYGAGSGLPEVNRLAERGVIIPAQHATDADSAALAQAASAPGGTELPGSILRLRLLDDYTIMVPSTDAKRLISNTLRWLRHAVEDAALLDELSRVRNESPAELRRMVKEESTAFWHDLCRTISTERQAIAYRRDRSPNDDLFQAAFLIMNYIEARSGAAQKRERRRERIDEELQALEEAIRKAEGAILDSSEFGRLMTAGEKRLGDLAPELQKRFTAQLLTPLPRRALAPVHYLHGDYLHRDNAFTLFDRLRAGVASRLQKEYVEVMKEMLRGKHPEYGAFFESRSAFEADILQRADAIDAVIVEFLEQPQMLAEALVHHTKMVRKNLTAEELRSVLSELFDVRSSTLLELPIVFGLSMVELFETAFARQSVFRQLWFRVSGRYENLHESYRKRTATRKHAPTRRDRPGDGATNEAHGQEGRGDTLPEEAAGVRTTGTGPRRREARTSQTPSGSRSQTPSPRPKTRKQVDRAWNEFGEALRKK